MESSTALEEPLILEEMFTLVTLKMASNMELEFTYGQMETSTKVSGLKISSMEEAHFSMQNLKSTL